MWGSDDIIKKFEGLGAEGGGFEEQFAEEGVCGGGGEEVVDDGAGGVVGYIGGGVEV